MKAKLLKKVRSEIRVAERNGMFAVQICYCDDWLSSKWNPNKKYVLDSYRKLIIKKARKRFGNTPKKIIR